MRYLTRLSLGNVFRLRKHNKYRYVIPMGDTQTPEQQAGARIKDRRVELGLSQEAVAEEMRRLGHPWHQTTVVKTEAAGRPLRVNEVTDLAAVLGVSVWELMGPQVYPSPELLQLSHAKENVDRLQRRVNELQRELALAVSNLQQAQAHEAEARLVVEAQLTVTATVTDNTGLTDAANLSKGTDGKH
jgi:transcriptional regulator with XRE-family HTH domain